MMVVIDRYTSEILKYNKVTLGSAETMFLTKLMGKPKSAYAVSSNLKDSGRQMAYKNVHTRIKTLERYNLIERIPEKFPHGAIYYRLTTQGLLYQLSRLVNLQDCDTLFWNDFLSYYSENVIFKTLLLSYFTKETIMRSNITLYFAILSYLRDCYQVTLDAADRIRMAIEEKNHKNEREYVKQLKNDLLWQARIFAFRLVTDSPNKGGGVVLGLLAKDKKFLKLLTDVYKNFDKGFNAVKGIHDKYYSNNS
jgi:hypothetical protein